MMVTTKSNRLGGRSRRRRGVVMVESALVFSVTLTLILGTMVMGLGIFRYQQVASLAREASRWASVRGSTYQDEQSAGVPSDQDVKTEMLKRAVILDPNALTFNLDQAKLATGTAAVTVTYRWTPEAYFAPITMTSTSQAQVQY